MSDYTLYYWPVPFRGQFVRAVLAFAGKDWDEVGAERISALMEGPVADMPVPFMGPPLLVDNRTGATIAQMPAILLYLGETLGLLPDTAIDRALCLKIVNDANEVIDEMTLDGGKQMGTEARWDAFEPRLRKWLSLWEETGRRHGLTAGAGHLLGSDAPGLADVVTATLWTTISARFPPIARIIDEAAPATAGLSRRVADLPALAALAAKARQDYGEAWCGGQIEASLRKVLAD